MRRLVGIEVSDLLGRQGPPISVRIDPDWEFVILHGPNGVGKTKFLEIIAHTFSFHPRTLLDIPFREAAFQFEDGVSLHVSKRTNSQLSLDVPNDEEPTTRPVIEYRLHGIQEDPVLWEGTLGRRRPRPALLRDIERALPVTRTGVDLWVDHTSNEHLTTEEVLDKYSDVRGLRATVSPAPPEPLNEFLDSIDIHLIETQRLLRFEPSHGRTAPRQRPTVTEYAKHLANQIAQALAQNSRTSQALDRTFPQRILQEGSEVTISGEISDDAIRERYQQQMDRRTNLSDIAVLDPVGDVPLPQRKLQTWERKVLWQWLDDSESKLATFQTLLERVGLMKDLINARFSTKELLIDSQRGFRFVTTTGLDLAPHQLSSGEQHELVLLYELLFVVNEGSIVLVDEPEISLHISWQQNFLRDIQRVAEIADLQFMIATHSPQIVHTWSERMVPLAQADNPEGASADA